MIHSPVKLLGQLISTPSVSREESATADLLQAYLLHNGIRSERIYNNVWAVQPGFDVSKPTLMLNSHHDTVRPSLAYTRDPHVPYHDGDRIYGLGSNDAGASVVSLIDVFMRLYREVLPFNLLLAITAEEEVMGEHGMRAFLPHLKSLGILPGMALVGEPTGMQPAVGERGLVVLDCMAKGVSGHAARKEGINALYKAIEDIDRLRNFKFPVCSELLGPIGIEVTMIKAGSQHNVIPDECAFVVDVRTTDAYSNEETVEMLRSVIKSEAVPRSTRVRASAINPEHPLVKAAEHIGGVPFVSRTTSDMALMYDIPSIKMGPGESSRSHTADEYIFESEITDAIKLYGDYIMALADIISSKK